MISRPPPYRCAVAILLLIAWTLMAAAVHPVSAGPADEDFTIEGLLKGGWQIAGYTGAMDNWSTFILFRHPDQPYLVQCRSGYDVTRQQRTQSHCYKLR